MAANSGNSPATRKHPQPAPFAQVDVLPKLRDIHLDMLDDTWDELTLHQVVQPMRRVIWLRTCFVWFHN